MELSAAVKLINHKNISEAAKTVWADMGCGSGLFTNALASKLAKGSRIYAIDKNAEALETNLAPANVVVEKLNADFIKDDFNLRMLDGILMANSLHFVQDKISLIQKFSNYLKVNGYFLIIEYDMDVPNQWVPFPLSYYSLQQLFSAMGYAFIVRIHELPSKYNRANIYSALIGQNQ